jgi:hypothetical protein
MLGTFPPTSNGNAATASSNSAPNWQRVSRDVLPVLPMQAKFLLLLAIGRISDRSR